MTDTDSPTTYTATLIGSDGTATVELDFISGLPQKSFVRSLDDDGEEMVWELVEDAPDYQYRQAGIPGADYS
ncbi:hypothetical protein [Glaciihabitans sp. dw_435]|uniref:hypothetical protein n=1 Tax=Glaciihabitans sp. dw_435 TaxID=2720081 RepID=UPI001BD5B766|nr:hypothetical protein [Glaciihabitans sp. dw_435]